MSAKVFFIPASRQDGPEKIVRKLKNLLTASEFDSSITDQDFIAVKTHFGERKNTTHIPPWFFKPLAARIRQQGGRPFLTETSTLYVGQRSDAVAHLLHAHEHGFSPDVTGMPIIMADGLVGGEEITVPISGELQKEVKIASLCGRIQGLVCVSHPTGHIAIGFGGALKNLGMGLSSRKGKMAQHSSVKPVVQENKCIACGVCLRWCPADAITLGEKANIHHEKCLGCGECLTVCRFGAIAFSWAMEGAVLQKNIAEHALGAVAGKKCFHINYLIDYTKDCDCMGHDQKPLVADIGLFASTDPVALDLACIHAIEKQGGKIIELGYPIDPMIQITHAAKIGLGSLEYEIVTVD